MFGLADRKCYWSVVREKAFAERIRAVLMTALTFILGMLPMVFASGAGAESRRAIGVATFSGMVASVVIGTLLVPGLYVLFCGRCNNK